MLFYTLTVLLLFQLIIYHAVDSSWWYLSNFYSDSVTDPNILCKVFPRNRKQYKICNKRSDLIFSIGESARHTISECQHQFRLEKWNCSVFERDFSVFGKYFVSGGTRELAFVQAMSSSSAVCSLARACSSGHFACECRPGSRRSFPKNMSTPDEFKWKGCTGNGVEFSLNFIRRFTDAEEYRRSDTKAKTAIHNNRAGREAFLQYSGIMCKCHGLSGSCSMRTCWRLLPNLRDIGNALKQRYDEAIKITLNPSARLIPLDQRQKKPNKSDLVYFDDSPDYCKIDRSKGLLGTENRICNETSEEPDSCGILCCGNGHEYLRRSVTYRCGCTFHWCCEVKCTICQEWRSEARCKAPFTFSKGNSNFHDQSLDARRYPLLPSQKYFIPYSKLRGRDKTRFREEINLSCN